MRIETQVRVAVPPRTAFEFFVWLDHLRLVSPSARKEWCPAPGRRIAEGVSHEVCLKQGRHKVQLRFTTEVVRPAETIVDVFNSWPLEGARRTLRFVSASEPAASEDTGDMVGAPQTLVVEEDVWRPPFFVRPLVDKRLEQQRDLFQEKLDRAADIIERAYLAAGPEVFTEGVVAPIRRYGLLPESSDALIGLPG